MGTELAGAIAEPTCRGATGGVRRIDPAASCIVPVQGADRLLAAFAPALSDRGGGDLRSLGVDVRPNTRFVGFDGPAAISGRERLPAAAIVRAGASRRASRRRGARAHRTSDPAAARRGPKPRRPAAARGGRAPAVEEPCKGEREPRDGAHRRAVPRDLAQPLFAPHGVVEGAGLAAREEGAPRRAAPRRGRGPPRRSTPRAGVLRDRATATWPRDLGPASAAARSWRSGTTSGGRRRFRRPAAYHPSPMGPDAPRGGPS